MLRSVCSPFLLGLLLLATLSAGCQTGTAGRTEPSATARKSRVARRATANHPRIRRVTCIYDHKPWLSLDKSGDRDPEGIEFRVFLDPGTGRGVLNEGTLHVEMYQLSRPRPGEVERTLMSDWHYATGDITTIRSRVLGDGYLLKLRWANKSTAGQEVEFVTRFEGSNGFVARSSTKSFRVPKYVS